MAYEEHWKAVFSGGLGTASPAPEEFSFSINFVPTVGVDQVTCDDMHGAASTMFADANSKIGSWAELTMCKLSQIDTTGHVVGAVIINDGHETGGSGSTVHPFQCSLAVSLRTGERGPSKRGRFYLPATAAVVNATNGEIDVAVRENIESAVSAFLVDFQEAGAGGNAIVVASQVVGNTNVTGFQVGRVIDTIRRRRRDLDEQYGDLIPIA